mmetsp:Transcript_8133/g.25321  ORF Transcript_8133/g.25321 Transcript_8133/m.25321 type:complete len:204 (-) Transcript_8133:1125-1736(-)
MLLHDRHGLVHVRAHLLRAPHDALVVHGCHGALLLPGHDFDRTLLEDHGSTSLSHAGQQVRREQRDRRCREHSRNGARVWHGRVPPQDLLVRSTEDDCRRLFGQDCVHPVALQSPLRTGWLLHNRSGLAVCVDSRIHGRRICQSGHQHHVHYHCVHREQHQHWFHGTVPDHCNESHLRVHVAARGEGRVVGLGLHFPEHLGQG